MEGLTYPSLIPRCSTFQFPWSVEQENSRCGLVEDSENIDCGSEPTTLPDTRIGDCDDDREMAWKIISTDEDAGRLAMQLLRENWSLFKDLRLEQWVEHVMGMSSATISLFESYHHRLGFSLFSFLCQAPGELEKYHTVAKKVRPSDRFLYNTIIHAIKSFENDEIYGTFNLDFSVITTPLKVMLSQPDKHVFRRLSVLKNRYKRFRTGTDIAQGREFETNTDFLIILSEKSGARIAWDLSRDTFAEFRKISLQSIHENDHHLRYLASRWNKLYYDVEDVASTRDLDENLMVLAKELHHLRNYFCLSAVLAGMAKAGTGSDTALAEFIDASGNFRLYRLKLHIEPSLPFLYPFIKDLKRGNQGALANIFSFIHYDQHLRRPEK